jgi:hypothetical protein
MDEAKAPNHKFQITNPSFIFVRAEKLVSVIGYWNLFGTWCLVLGIFQFERSCLLLQVIRKTRQ